MNRRRVLTLSSALLAGSLAGCQEPLLGEDGTPASTSTGTAPGDGAPTDAIGSTATDGDTPTPTESGTPTPTESDSTATPGQELSDMAALMPAADPTVAEATLSTLVGSTNAFAIDLYQQLGTEKQGQNLFTSPISVSVALAMTYAGARGQTRTQMRETLQYSLDDDSLHPAFNRLQQTLLDRDDAGVGTAPDTDTGTTASGDDGVPFQFHLVNAVWGQEGYPFRDSYLGTLEDHYVGGFTPVDFVSDAPGVRETINDWVADQTEDRIPELLPGGSLNSLTRLVLTNAIYFVANWEHTFPKDATEQDQFTALSGTTTDVPTMTQTATLPYAEVGGAQAVELPYVGGDVAMLVILPPEGEFASYEADFDRTTLSAIVDGLNAQKGTVRLPKFEFDTSVVLSSALQTLGMPIAFDDTEADFSGMADLEQSGENLAIDDAYHDTYVAVDEEGTEAAAATAVVIGTTSAPTYDFVADRPFLFAIRDRPTGTLLFLGRVTDAGAAQPSSD